jgi:signal transduction histidine kinase
MPARPRLLYGLASLVAMTSVGLCVVDAILTGINNPKLEVNWLQSAVPHLLIGSLYGVVGAIILVRRPGDRIGWLFCAVGLLFPVESFAEQYAHLGLLTAPGSLPGAAAMAWLQSWLLWLFWPGCIVYLLLLFPTGKPPSRRWWPVAWATALFAVTMVVASLISPGRFNDVMRSNGVISYWFPATNPIGFQPLSDLLRIPDTLARMGTYALILVAAFAAVRRFRRSTAVERQQLKWLAYAGAVIFAGVLVLITSRQQVGQVETGLDIILVGTLVGIPAAAGIAILKYHLYDIDLVINKTLLYGAMAAFITLIYVAIVVGVGHLVGQGGKPNLGLSILATALVAVAFQPVRERIQRVANRLVYGKRATPYEALSEFSDRIASTYSDEEVLPRLAQTIAESTGAAQAVIWAKDGSENRALVSWPGPNGSLMPALGAAGEGSHGDRVVPVQHQGEVLGALSIRKDRGDAITPLDEKLLADLASPAGVVLRNLQLTRELRARLAEISAQTTELQASSARIIAAQDSTRRRLERNIHDGAQQHLVAIAVKLRLAATLARRDPARGTRLLDELEVEMHQALETLHALARGIYPPILRELGLESAIRAQATRFSLPVDVSAHGLARYPSEVEAAAYFCCLEALQNVAKHANATQVRIRLAGAGGELAFSVDDDGIGFDPTRTRQGSGLQNIADRLAALGGHLTVAPRAEGGTSLRGRVPVRNLEPVA